MIRRLLEQLNDAEFDLLKADVEEMTEWNNHLEARILIAQTLIPEYVEKFQKFVNIAKNMQGFTMQEIQEREELTKAMFADLVSIIGLKKTQELYGCL